jgi:hypothetical protein
MYTTHVPRYVCVQYMIHLKTCPIIGLNYPHVGKPVNYLHGNHTYDFSMSRAQVIISELKFVCKGVVS